MTYNNSALTAIARTRPSRPVRYLLDNRLVLALSKDVLDYGAGYGLDAETYGWRAYDPKFSKFAQRPTWPEYFSFILCTYVLCVLEYDEVKSILADIYQWLRPGGVAYLTVRRGNYPLGRKYRQDGSYTMQTDVYLSLPIVISNKDFDIYEWRKDATTKNPISKEQAHSVASRIIQEVWYNRPSSSPKDSKEQHEAKQEEGQ